jgi:hypothetical protein
MSSWLHADKEAPVSCCLVPNGYVLDIKEAQSPAFRLGLHEDQTLSSDLKLCGIKGPDFDSGFASL